MQPIGNNLEELVSKYSSALKELTDAGFTNRKQNIKLLIKTNGNVEIVARFLEAKNRIKDAQKDIPKSDKRLKRDISKVLLKEDSDTSSSSSDSEDREEKKRAKRAKKEFKKQEKQERKELKHRGKKDRKDDQSLANAMDSLCTVKEEYIQNVNVEIKSENRKEKKSPKEKEEREKLRWAKKQEREERKVKKEEDRETQSFVTTLPDGIEDVYIDGNNLAYVLSPIRSMVLTKGMSRAESAMQVIAQEWHKLIPEKKVTLIFDDTNKNLTEGSFRVCTARPLFKTSDDALVHWASQLAPEKAVKTLVFTSDRELTNRLQSLGVQVLKSKCFFKIVALKLGQQADEGLDAWSGRFLANKTF